MDKDKLVELAERLERMVDEPAWQRYYMDKTEAAACAAALRSHATMQTGEQI